MFKNVKRGQLGLIAFDRARYDFFLYQSINLIRLFIRKLLNMVLCSGNTRMTERLLNKWHRYIILNQHVLPPISRYQSKVKILF
jgi:hypothetical protein